MRRLIKKNQVIVTGLAILIAVAGYVKYTYDNGTTGEPVEQANNDVYEQIYGDDIQLMGNEDIESLEEPEETTLEPGAAVLTNQTEFGQYYIEAKLNKEQIRSQNIEDLQKIIDNESLSETEKKEAVDSMVQLKNNMELENTITSLLAAKGYENVLVIINDEQVDVILPESELNENAKTQVESVVKRKTGMSADHITITPAKE